MTVAGPPLRTIVTTLLHDDDDDDDDDHHAPAARDRPSCTRSFRISATAVAAVHGCSPLPRPRQRRLSPPPPF
jgi:hypothetical protein